MVKHKASIQETIDVAETEASILEKLTFIESVVSKYRQPDNLDSYEIKQIEDVPTSAIATNQTLDITPKSTQAPNSRSQETEVNRLQRKVRSPLCELGWVTKELNPDYEQKVVSELRARRRQNRIAICWLVILLIVPFAVHILTKNLIFEPILNRYSKHNAAKIELNQEIRENFLTEFGHFKESLIDGDDLPPTGTTLYHSFGQFFVPTGGSATFDLNASQQE